MFDISEDTKFKIETDVLLSQYKEARARYNDLIKARDNVIYSQIITITTISAAIILNVSAKIGDVSIVRDKPLFISVIFCLINLTIIILCYTNSAYIKDEFRIYRISVFCSELEKKIMKRVNIDGKHFWEFFQGRGYYKLGESEGYLTNNGNLNESFSFHPPSVKYMRTFLYITALCFVSFLLICKGLVVVQEDLGKYFYFAITLITNSTIFTIFVVFTETKFVEGLKKRIIILNDYKTQYKIQ